MLQWRRRGGRIRIRSSGVKGNGHTQDSGTATTDEVTDSGI
jgi:hypothetical protein